MAWQIKSQKALQLLEQFKGILSAHELREEYHTHLLSERQIAEKYSIPRHWVRKLLETYEIAPLTKTQRSWASAPLQLTETEQNVVLGCLLGYGGVFPSPRKDPGWGTQAQTNHFFKISFFVEDAGYVEFLRTTLEAFYPRLTHDSYMRDGKDYERVGICTRVHPVWNGYRHIFYGHQGPDWTFKSWLSTYTMFLTLPVFAHWFCNVGNFRVSLNNPRRTALCMYPRIIGLHRPDNAQLLCTYLEEQWGLRFSYRYGYIHRKPMLTLHPSCYQHFNDIVGPHVPGCMRYKLPTPRPDRVGT